MTPETKVLRAGQPYPEDYRRICSAGANFHQIPNNFISRKIFFKLKRNSK